jgi:hypothetical protein
VTCIPHDLLIHRLLQGDTTPHAVSFGVVNLNPGQVKVFVAGNYWVEGVCSQKQWLRGYGKNLEVCHAPSELP